MFWSMGLRLFEFSQIRCAAGKILTGKVLRSWLVWGKRTICQWAVRQLGTTMMSLWLESADLSYLLDWFGGWRDLWNCEEHRLFCSDKEWINWRHLNDDTEARVSYFRTNQAAHPILDSVKENYHWCCWPSPQMAAVVQTSTNMLDRDGHILRTRQRAPKLRVMIPRNPQLFLCFLCYCLY